MIKIHEKLWYVIAPTREDDLAYLTYYEDNAAFEKRKSTGMDWATPRRSGRWVEGVYVPDEDTVSAPVGVVIDNSPIKGVYIGSSVSRWSTSNKLFRVKDPRGFTVEVPTDNIATLLHLTTVVNGAVQEECVWGREGNNHILLPVNSEPYLDTLEKMDILENKLTNVKELKVGDVVKFFDVDGEYTFIGRGKPVWKITPYEMKCDNTRWYSHKSKVPQPDKAYEVKGKTYKNIFKATRRNYEDHYTEYNNPKIVEILRNVEVDRSQVNIRIWPPHSVCMGNNDHETIRIEWKD